MIFAKHVFLCLTRRQFYLTGRQLCLTWRHFYLTGGTCASQGSNCGLLLHTFASYKETIAKPGENLYFAFTSPKLCLAKYFVSRHPMARCI